MKKVLIMALLMAVVVVGGTLPVFADSIPSNLEVFDETVVGAKIDLPDLVKFTDNMSLGTEVGITDMFEDWDQSGFVFVKFTGKWSLLDFTKK